MASLSPLSHRSHNLIQQLKFNTKGPISEATKASQTPKKHKQQKKGIILTKAALNSRTNKAHQKTHQDYSPKILVP